MEQKVYITRRIPQIGINLLQDKFQVDIFPENRPITRGLLMDKIKGCQGIVSLLSDAIDEEVIRRAPDLKIISNYAVGYNNIDVQAAKRQHIMVTNTPGVLTNATAETAFALLIALTRKIIEADRFTRAGKFIGWDPMLFLGDELKGMTIGIIGLGRIGKDMAGKCRAFGMNIQYYNRHRVNPEIEMHLAAEYRPLDALLAESDVISIHTPLNKETHHLMTREKFSLMKAGSYLINTSRGEVVYEKALVEALASGKLRGAGLDVYEYEPRINEELLGMNNVILLPHIGSATKEARNRMAEMAACNVIAALEGKTPDNLVPEMIES